MNEKELKRLRVIDVITGSIYNLTKGAIPAIVMSLLFKSQVGGMDFMERIIITIVLFSGICVEYLKLNKYLNIISFKQKKKIEDLLK